MTDVLNLIKQQQQQAAQIQAELPKVQQQQSTFNTVKDTVTDNILAIEKAKQKNIQSNAAFQSAQLEKLSTAQKNFRAIEDGGFVAGVEEAVADAFGGIFPDLKQFSRAAQLKDIQRTQQDLAIGNKNAALTQAQLDARANVEKATLRDAAANLDAANSQLASLRSQSKASFEAFQQETALKSAAIVQLSDAALQKSTAFTPQQKKDEMARREAKAIQADLLRASQFQTSQAVNDRLKMNALKSLTLPEKNKLLTESIQNGGVIAGEKLGLPAGITVTSAELQSSRDQTAQSFSNEALNQLEADQNFAGIDATISTIAGTLGLSKALTGDSLDAQIKVMKENPNLSVEDKITLGKLEALSTVRKQNNLDSLTLKGAAEAGLKLANKILKTQETKKIEELKLRKRPDEVQAAKEYYGSGGTITSVESAASVVEDAVGSSTGNAHFDDALNSIESLTANGNQTEADNNRALKNAGVPNVANLQAKIKLIADTPALQNQVRKTTFDNARFSLYNEVIQNTNDPQLVKAFQTGDENVLYKTLAARKDDGSDGITLNEFLKQAQSVISDFSQRELAPSGVRKFTQSAINNIVFDNDISNMFVQKTIQLMNTVNASKDSLREQLAAEAKVREQAASQGFAPQPTP